MTTRSNYEYPVNENSNNGLITKIWGPGGWDFLHAITFGYPLNPTDEQREQYNTFFTSVAYVLPCVYCRISYGEFIKTNDTELTKNDLENRYTLTNWLYRLHQAVNKKLGVDYHMSYDELVKKFESYRAKCNKQLDQKIKGCVTPLDHKSQSYKNYYNKECCIIPIELAKKFLPLINKYNMPNVYESVVQLAEKYIDSSNKMNDYSKLKKHPLWTFRNKMCNKIIAHMRIYSIPSLENGLPTYYELILILLLTSNLSIDELNKISIEL
jgi:hypothetical protein